MKHIRKLISFTASAVLISAAFAAPLRMSDLSVCSITASAEDGYLTRQNADGTVTITKYNGTEKKIYIPSEINGRTVTEIGSYAFSKLPITYVKIPETVKSIGYAAFSYCSSLSTASMQEGLISVDDYAFAYCTSLFTAFLPNTVTSAGTGIFMNCTGAVYGGISKVMTYVPPKMYSGCTSLKEIVLTSEVLTVGERAFYGCTSLTDLRTFPYIRKIGREAFSGCTMLADFTFPTDTNDIGMNAFEGTAWLDAQEDGIVYAGKVIYTYKGEMPEKAQFHIDKKIMGIAEGAFMDQPNLAALWFDGYDCVISGDGRTICSSCDEETGTAVFSGRIYCSGNSPVVDYCKKYGYKYFTIGGPEHLTGDANDDGSINPVDATLTLCEYTRRSAGVTDGLEILAESADADKDGRITPADATLILSYYSYKSAGGINTLDNYIRYGGI